MHLHCLRRETTSLLISVFVCHSYCLIYIFTSRFWLIFNAHIFFADFQYVFWRIFKFVNRVQVPHRQRLVWKLSNRTLKHLRPTDKLRATLPKISEESLDRLVIK